MGFYIATVPLPFWRLVLHVFGYIVCFGVFRTLLHKHAFRAFPLRYREWIIHALWSTISIWFYLNASLDILPRHVKYTWKWLQLAYVIVDVMWAIEHRSRRVLTKGWQLRIIWEIMYIITCILYVTDDGSDMRWILIHNSLQMVASGLAFIFI